MIHELPKEITIPFSVFKSEAACGRGFFDLGKDYSERLPYAKDFTSCLQFFLKERDVDYVCWQGERIKVDKGAVVTSSADSRLCKHVVTLPQILSVLDNEITNYYRMVSIAENNYLNNHALFPKEDDFARNLVYGIVSRMLQSLRIQKKAHFFNPSMITLNQGDVIRQALGVDVDRPGFCESVRDIANWDFKKVWWWLNSHFSIEEMNNLYCKQLSESMAKPLVEKKDYNMHSVMKMDDRSFKNFQVILHILEMVGNFQWMGKVANTYNKVKVLKPVVQALHTFVLKHGRAQLEKCSNLSERGML